MQIPYLEFSQQNFKSKFYLIMPWTFISGLLNMMIVIKMLIIVMTVMMIIIISSNNNDNNNND